MFLSFWLHIVCIKDVFSQYKGLQKIVICLMKNYASINWICDLHIFIESVFWNKEWAWFDKLWNAFRQINIISIQIYTTV